MSLHSFSFLRLGSLFMEKIRVQKNSQSYGFYFNTISV